MEANFQILKLSCNYSRRQSASSLIQENIMVVEEHILTIHWQNSLIYFQELCYPGWEPVYPKPFFGNTGDGITREVYTQTVTQD